MTDTDLNWGAFDAARGLHPRAAATMTAAQQANAQPVIKLSPAAQAQVKLIQKEAGLPETGQLDPATVAYAKQAYAKSLKSGGSGGSKKSKAKKSSSKSSSKSSKAKTAAQLLKQKKEAARKAAAQAKAIQRKESVDEYNWEKGELKNERQGKPVRVGHKTGHIVSSGTLFKQATNTAAQGVKVGKPVKRSKHGGHKPHKPGQRPSYKSKKAKVSLANEIVGSQDGPRMTTTKFGGKKAAPFKKGGGRSKTAPRDAKGRKRAVAKAVARKQAMHGGTLDNATAAKRKAAVDLAISPNGRPMDTRPLGKPGSKRQLSDYERGIAHALMRKGIPESRAIAMARGLTNKAARSGRWARKGKASAATIAGSQASVAQRASFSVSADGKYREVDLADGAKWHHGFVPANAEAVLEKEHKAHGSGPESGKKALADYKKFHSDSTKQKMTITDLREHAKQHSDAASRARTPASKQKHLKEAQDSLNTIQNKRDARTKRETAKEVVRVAPKKAAAKKAKSAKADKVKPKKIDVRDKADVKVDREGNTSVPHVAGAERDLNPHELLREIKEAKDNGDKKRQKVLAAEVKRRVGQAKLAQLHAAKAKELIETDWDKTEGKPKARKALIAKVTKIAPFVKPHIERAKRIKEKNAFKTMVDEAYRIVVDKIIPYALASGLAAIGVPLVGHIFGGGGG